MGARQALSVRRGRRAPQAGEPAPSDLSAAPHPADPDHADLAGPRRPAEPADARAPVPSESGPVPAPQLLLDNQLCFLFHRITRDLTAAYRPLLADLGITYPQYLVMLVLWERDGLGVGEIGDRLCLDSGTLSPLLRRLASAGLVERRRDAEDERRVTVHLTAEGRALRGRALSVPATLAGRLVDDRAAYAALHRQLSQLAQRLEG